MMMTIIFLKDMDLPLREKTRQEIEGSEKRSKGAVRIAGGFAVAVGETVVRGKLVNNILYLN